MFWEKNTHSSCPFNCNGLGHDYMALRIKIWKEHDCFDHWLKSLLSYGVTMTEDSGERGKTEIREEEKKKLNSRNPPYLPYSSSNGQIPPLATFGCVLSDRGLVPNYIHLLPRAEPNKAKLILLNENSMVSSNIYIARRRADGAETYQRILQGSTRASRIQTIPSPTSPLRALPLFLTLNACDYTRRGLICQTLGTCGRGVPW